MIKYITTYDLSRVSGPSINEQSFITFLNENHKEILESSCSYQDNNNRGRIIKVILQNIFLLKEINKTKSKPSLILRLDLFPLSLYFLKKKNFNGIFLKTAGDGKYRVLNEKKYGRFFVYIQKRILKDNLHKFSGIDCVTKCQAKRFQSEFGIKPFVVPNSVDIEKFKPQFQSDSEGKIIVGYGGTNAHTRGGIEVIKIVKILREHDYNAFGVITGDSKDYNNLKEMIYKYDLDNYIELTGTIPADSIPNIIARFSIGVSFLSEEQRCASEQKVRQYFACGVPALLSPSEDNLIFENNDLAIIIDDELNLKSIKKVLALNKVKIRKYAEAHLSLTAINNKRLKNWNLL